MRLTSHIANRLAVIFAFTVTTYLIGWTLENLVGGKVVNEIKVDPHTRKFATVALERMLAIKGTGNPIGKQQPAGTTVD